MSLAESISKNVKAMRERHGLSQQQLAQKTGVSIRYISQLENRAPNVTVDVVEKIAHALKCSPYQLMVSEKLEAPPGALNVLNRAIALLKSLRTHLRHANRPGAS